MDQSYEVDEVINEQVKRLKVLDSADVATRKSAFDYTLRLIEKSGYDVASYLFNQSSIEPKTKDFIEVVVHSVNLQLNMVDAISLTVIKDIVGRVANRQNGICRRSSKKVKAKTFELSRAGDKRLRELKDRSKKSYSLIIEDLLVGSEDLYKEMKTSIANKNKRISQLQEQVSDLKDTISKLNHELESKPVETGYVNIIAPNISEVHTLAPIEDPYSYPVNVDNTAHHYGTQHQAAPVSGNEFTNTNLSQYQIDSKVGLRYQAYSEAGFVCDPREREQQNRLNRFEPNNNKASGINDARERDLLAKPTRFNQMNKKKG